MVVTEQIAISALLVAFDLAGVPRREGPNQDAEDVNPIADSSTTANVDFVMKDGTVYRDSRHRGDPQADRKWK